MFFSCFSYICIATDAREVLTESKKIYNLFEVLLPSRNNIVMLLQLIVLLPHHFGVLKFPQYNGLGRYEQKPAKEWRKKQSWIITIFFVLSGGWGWCACESYEIISNYIWNGYGCCVFVRFLGAITRCACRIHDEQMLLIIIWLEPKTIQNTVIASLSVCVCLLCVSDA